MAESHQQEKSGHEQETAAQTSSGPLMDDVDPTAAEAKQPDHHGTPPDCDSNTAQLDQNAPAGCSTNQTTDETELQRSQNSTTGVADAATLDPGQMTAEVPDSDPHPNDSAPGENNSDPETEPPIEIQCETPGTAHTTTDHPPSLDSNEGKQHSDDDSESRPLTAAETGQQETGETPASSPTEPEPDGQSSGQLSSTGQATSGQIVSPVTPEGDQGNVEEPIPSRDTADVDKVAVAADLQETAAEPRTSASGSLQGQGPTQDEKPAEEAETELNKKIEGSKAEPGDEITPAETKSPSGKRRVIRKKIREPSESDLLLLKMTALDESAEPTARGAPSKPAIFLENFGVSYGLDLFSLLNNSVRRELSDLYDLLWALDKFGDSISWKDLMQFFEWWNVFEAFTRESFKLSEKFTYPLLTTLVNPQGLASNTTRMRQKQALVESIADVNRSRAKYAKAPARSYLFRLFNLVDRFAPTMLAFFAHEEKNLPTLIEEHCTEKDKEKIDAHLVAWIAKSRSPDMTFSIILRWMTPEQRSYWRKKVLPMSVDRHLAGWAAVFERDHLVGMRDILGRAKMPTENGHFGQLGPRSSSVLPKKKGFSSWWSRPRRA